MSLKQLADGYEHVVCAVDKPYAQRVFDLHRQSIGYFASKYCQYATATVAEPSASAC